MDPENKVILTRAGDAYRNTGDYRKAEEYYTKAMDIDFDIYAVLGLALIYKGEGRYEEAIERLKSLIRNDPKNYRPYIDLADCYVKINRMQDAADVLKSFQAFGIHNPAVNGMLDNLENSIQNR